MLLGQPDRRLVGEAGIGRGVGQLLHLRRGGVGEFLAAVADIDVPQRGQGVDVFAAVGGAQHGALPRDVDLRGGVILGEVQRVDQVALIGRHQSIAFRHKVVHCLHPSLMLDAG